MQPLALAACEKFGATLAMCSETNKKIEDLIIKVSGPKAVRFISAQVGYSANDCATHLSRSLAGVQFLGLAAALVSSVDLFEGANALSVMVMASASDKTLLPTPRQLKDLLGAMAHRLDRSGFTDIWAGYQVLLFGAFNSRKLRMSDAYFQRPSELADFMYPPGIDGVSKLVEAFRELNRLGDVTAVAIKATSCAPWVMAFTRWCLGIPPSTYLPDGKALLDQPDSRVTLFTGNGLEASAIDITVQKSIGSPADLLRSGASPLRPSGMVTVETFFRLRCQKVGGEGSDAYKALSEALPYALKQTCELLRVSDEIYELKGLEQSVGLASEEYFDSARPFPKDSVIANLLTRVLNLESHQDLRRLDDGKLISDLPLVRLYLCSLAESCPCGVCKTRTDRRSICKGKLFLSTVSLYVVDILALSILECPETLLVLFDQRDHELYNFENSFRGTVKAIIETGSRAACKPEDVLVWTLALVGHKIADVENRGWVISYSKGQVIWPKVFETRNIHQPGFLMLYWAPGLLFFDGETYDRCMASIQMTTIEATDTHLIRPFPPVTRPLNLVPTMKLEWKVVRLDGYLELSPICGQHSGLAFEILLNLANSLILDECPHDSASSLDKSDLLARYAEPFPSHKHPTMFSQARTSTEIETPIDVIAVDRDDGLRMFALSTSMRPQYQRLSVIRGNACLQCCLDLCRRFKYDQVIC